ncbi:hypothetical protein [Kitasatospora sp. NPDC004531]
MPDGFDGSYVVRFAWTRRAAALFVVTTLMVASGFVPGIAGPDHLQFALVPIPLLLARICSGRHKLVELDRRGITVHRPPLIRRTSEFIPWSDVLSLEWGRRLGVELLTVKRRRDPAPVRSDLVGELLRAVRIERDTGLSDLDPVLLASALTRLAPEVRIVRIGDLPPQPVHTGAERTGPPR